MIGKFDKEGNISGRVLGGNRGPLGTFFLKPIDKKELKQKKKYEGLWVGSAVMPNGFYRPVEILISAGLAEVTNPPDFEFGFTPGKMANFVWDGVKFSFNNIAIDYLRQRLLLSSIDNEGRSLMTAECDADFGEVSTLRGSLYGAYKGKSADFGMRKAR